MRKNKKVLWLIIMMLILLTACSSKEKDEVFILTGSNGVDMSEERFKGFSINPSDFGINPNWENVKEDNVEKIKKPEILEGREFEYQNTRHFLVDNDKNEYGNLNRSFDIYEHNDENGITLETIEYFSGTDIICDYLAYVEGLGIYEGNGNSKDIAEEFLIQMVSEEEFEKYELVSQWKDQMYGDDCYRYSRIIEGYQTEDILYVTINQSGMVRSYGASKYNKFLTLEDEITKERLDEARGKLANKISETFGANAECGEPVIRANATGELFIEMNIYEEYFTYTMITTVD